MKNKKKKKKKKKKRKKKKKKKKRKKKKKKHNTKKTKALLRQHPLIHQLLPYSPFSYLSFFPACSQVVALVTHLPSWSVFVKRVGTRAVVGDCICAAPQVFFCDSFELSED